MVNLLLFSEKKDLFFLGGLVLAAILIGWLIVPSYGAESLRQVTWLAGMDKCVQGGQLPCRWVPDLDGMYGYPLFNYYAPLPYYVGEIFYLLIGSFSLAVKLTWLVASLGALLFSFLFFSYITRARKLIILTAVYPLITITTSLLGFPDQAEGVVWTMAFLPAVFWSLILIYKNAKIHHLLLISVILLFFILSDRYNFFLLFPTLIGAVGIICKKKIDLQAKRFLFSAVVLGFMLSAFFWLPLFLEKGDVYQEISEQSKGEFFPSYPPSHLPRFFPSGWQIITGETEIIDYQEGIDKISFQTNTPEHTIVRLSEYYFPGWQVKVDNKIALVDYKNSLGMMTFILGEGQHLVEVQLVDTPVRIVANILSAVGFGIFFILTLTQFHKIRRWFFYYIRSIKR